MSMDEIQRDHEIQNHPVSSRTPAGIFVVLFAIIVGLGISQFYLLAQIHSLRNNLAGLEVTSRADTDQQVAAKFAAIENSTSQALAAMKTELDGTSARMGATGNQIRRARALVTTLQKHQQDDAAELKWAIAEKADAQQVGALKDDISATKTDLEDTRKAVDATRSDLGMARSEFGTLIARNHDDLEQLRKMGERDYYEFTLPRNKQQNVAGVGLVLKKVNVKRHRFNLDLVADDMVIEKKDKTVNEPVFFAVKDSKKFYELVINQVQSNQVKGYISTPKGATEMAMRSGG